MVIGASASPITGSATRPARASGTRRHAGVIGVPARWRASSVITASASSAPVSATTKLSSGAPPSVTNDRNAPVGWLNASRPQGKPPNGCRPRSASSATQSEAVHNGQYRSRCATASAPPSTAR